MRGKKPKRMKFIIWILIVVIFVQFVCGMGTLSVKAASEKKLTLKTAQNMAVKNSIGYRKVLNKIEIQEIKYATAVKSIKMKKKNMSTFRWTPLLSFKFPEKPTLADEYEWQYKPLQITCTINELKHQLKDEKLASKESVSLAYVETYICQEKINFYEERLENAKDTLQKNQIKLALGEATQEDIDKMQQKVNRLTTELSLQMRTFENYKKKLSKLINMDVTSGYTFSNPFVSADIPRSILDQLVEYTLSNDHEYYQIKLETALSLQSLNMMESMMKNQYGGKMSVIEPYIQQALNGENIDSSAFKQAYNQMLEDIDAPWRGTKRILFIKINKEWFKGAVDGSRYVEDDPYALYAGALEYADAVREKESAEEELTQNVKNDFETLKTAQIAYEDAVKSSEEMADNLAKSTELNRLGNLTYEELADIQEEYEEQEMSKLELLGEYSKLLYAYDRLTCGGITAYLEGTDITMKTAQGGNSYLAYETNGTAYYYIESVVEDNLFRFGVSIPENFSIDITHFELYVNGEKIGNKTEVTEYLEHLALDLDMTESVKLYLYNEDELIEICDIDASVYQDVLDITGGYTLVEEQTIEVVATYKYTMLNNTNMVTLEFTPQTGEPISYYRLEDEDGKCVLGDDLIDISQEFQYLSLLVGDLSQIRVAFFDKSENQLYKGYFDTITSSVIKEQ